MPENVAWPPGDTVAEELASIVAAYSAVERVVAIAKLALIEGTNPVDTLFLHTV